MLWLQRNLIDCHLLQSWVNSCHHTRDMFDTGYISGYLKRWYSSYSPSRKKDFFFFFFSPAKLSIIYPAGIWCIQINIARIVILHPKPWGLLLLLCSSSPAHTCSAFPLPLCVFPLSYSSNSFWMLPVRQEWYSTTDLNPGVWIKYTKSSQILIDWKWVSSSEWHRALLFSCLFFPALG